MIESNGARPVSFEHTVSKILVLKGKLVAPRAAVFSGFYAGSVGYAVAHALVCCAVQADSFHVRFGAAQIR